MTDNTSTAAARLSQAKASLAIPAPRPVDRDGRPVCIGHLIYDVDTEQTGLVFALVGDSLAYVRVAGVDGRLMLSSARAGGVVVSDFPRLALADVSAIATLLSMPVEPRAVTSSLGTTFGPAFTVRRIAGELVRDKQTPTSDAIDAATDQLADLVKTITPLLARVSHIVNETLTFIDDQIRIDVHSLADATLMAITELQADVVRARAAFV